MRRWLTVLVIILVCVFVIAFLALMRAPDMLANNLSKKLGVKVAVARISPSFTEIEIETPPLSLLKETIVIDEIEFDTIYLGLEFDSTTSGQGNWTQIMRQFKENQRKGRRETKKVLIKKVRFTNIHTDLLFREGNQDIKKLPVIKEIVLTNISTEGKFPVDQLLGSILGQMIKQVFVEQNLDNMLKGLFLDAPGKAVDSVLKPFKGLLNLADPCAEDLCEKREAV